MKFKLFTLSLLSGCMLSFAQNFQKEKLDEYFTLLEQNDKFHGSVAISQKGKIVYSRNIGYADIHSKTRGNVDTQYRIGSITKTFTAALVFKAVEEGKLSIDHYLNQYFPTVKNAEKIQIRDLMNHSSGIFSITSDPSFQSWMTQKQTPEKLVEIISSYEPQFDPKSTGEYSNSNYILLTLILEKVYGKSYQELVEEKIINPLGLKNTHYAHTHDLKNNSTYSYLFTGIWKKMPETDMSVPLGAGAISSTPIDLTKFGEALFSGKLIQPKSLESMTQLHHNFGMGIFEVKLAERSFWGHGGAIDGFLAFWATEPKDEVSIAVCTNGTKIGYYGVGEILAKAFYGFDFELPNFANFTLTEEEIASYLGTYSSSEFPLKITIFAEKNQLYGQATGQGPFPLDALGDHQFEFQAAGIKIKFNPNEGNFEFEQAGFKFVFTKEK